MIAHRPLGFLNPTDGTHPRSFSLQGRCSVGEQSWSRQRQPRAPCCLSLPALLREPARGWHPSPPRPRNRHVWHEQPQGRTAVLVPHASGLCSNGWARRGGTVPVARR